MIESLSPPKRSLPSVYGVEIWPMTPFFEKSKPPGLTHTGKGPQAEQNGGQGIGIPQLFRPVIVLLKILGYCPLSYREKTVHQNDEVNEVNRIDLIVQSDPDKKEMEYKLIFKSWSFLWAFIIALFFTIKKVLNIFGLHTAYENTWWLEVQTILSTKLETAGSEVKMIARSMLLYYSFLRGLSAVITITENILAWGETPQFANFLNNWNQFELQFGKIFANISPFDNKKLKRRRNILLALYVASPTLIMTIATAIVVSKEDFVAMLVGILIIAPFAIQGLSAALLEDAKAILTYDVIANAFAQIKRGIEEASAGGNEKLTAGKVRLWRGLLYKVRYQAILAGRYQKNHQLFLIFSTIIQITLLSFLVLLGTRLPSTGDLMKLIVQGIGFLLVMVGRVYLKILATDKITRNELLIAGKIESVDTLDCDFSTLVELKFIYDMIKHDPCVISFGHYVTLNKKLLLGIFSQVITYLIVLMQFAQTARP